MSDSNDQFQELDDDWEASEGGSERDDASFDETEGADAAPASGDAASEEGGRRPRRRRRKRRGDSGPEDAAVGDERAQQAVQFVTDVVREMEMDCRVRLKKNGAPAPEDPEAEAEIVIEISGKDSGRIIGKKGQVLGALQFLTHRAVNRPGLPRRHVLVDAEGYRSRRDDSLALMARRLGKQAVDEGKIITFEPMNPRDRRVVHLALAKFEGVITKSEGEGDDRRVQIIPVRR